MDIAISTILPLRRRFWSRPGGVGLAVAGLGTAAPIMIAATTLDRDTGGYDAVTFARVLIATGALLINMAHVVAAIRAETAKGRPRRRRPFVI